MDLLTQSQVARLQRVFMCFAKQIDLSDGTSTDGISAVELRAVMQALGLHATDAELHETISRCDTKGRGYLDLAEFIQLMCNELPDTDNETELIEIFNFGHIEKDGVLDRLELAQILASAVPPGTEAAAETPLTEADLTAIIEEAAGPGAKGMTLPQFLQLMRAQQ